MSRNAWVLRLKEGVSSHEHDDKKVYLTDDEDEDFLTDDLNKATIIYNKEQEIQRLKKYDKFFIENYGKDSVRNFGWENISKNFDFVEVEVIEDE